MKSNSDLFEFKQFGKADPSKKQVAVTSDVVAYIRVSGRRQMDNMSIPLQRKTIDEYALRNNLRIVEYFGQTHESAKNDDRKEFKRMLDFVKSKKNKVSQVLVYMLDRFSRTGGSAINLKNELYNKHGIVLTSVTQPTNIADPSGEFSQDMQLLVSHYDNQLRKKRAMDGMRERFRQGHWMITTPMGYDKVIINDERRLVINEVGKKLRKAFHWKDKGMKNVDIIARLNAMGVKMYKQQLQKIFKNPFYCGIIAHALLDGEIVEGKFHEPLISKELFLRINEIRKHAHGYGISHTKENENLPLKIFMKCGQCGSPYTGYIVKKKNLWYYKCRVGSCSSNKSAKSMHSKFESLLSPFVVQPNQLELLQYHLEYLLNDLVKDSLADLSVLHITRNEIQKKIDTIEEKFYAMDAIDKQTFTKLHFKYLQERSEIEKEISRNEGNSSNLENGIKQALQISTKALHIWRFGNITQKDRIQSLIFPKGIAYNKKNDTVLTNNINGLFLAISLISMDLVEKKESPYYENIKRAMLVRKKGLEPPRREAPDPKSGAATNYATSAVGFVKDCKNNENLKIRKYFPENIIVRHKSLNISK